jgi:hypothetical protein
VPECPFEHILGAFDVVLPAHPGQGAQVRIGIANLKSVLHNGHDWLPFFVSWHPVTRSYDFETPLRLVRNIKACRNITRPLIARIWAAKDRQALEVPAKLVSITRDRSASYSSSVDPLQVIPVAFTRIATLRTPLSRRRAIFAQRLGSTHCKPRRFHSSRINFDP